jgi:replicative DNA helicase
MHYGELLLSKMIDENNSGVSIRYGVKEEHFPTLAERKVYQFIKEYALTNKGNVPDYRTILTNITEFHYHENVTDSYEYLTGELKNYYARTEIKNFLQTQAVPRFNEDEKQGIEYAKWVREKLDEILKNSDSRQEVGINLKGSSTDFLAEYERRKAGISYTIWKSAFPKINKEINGYFSGNLYTWYGRSGRGKSVFTLREAVEFAFQGANVLIWAMELGWFELMVRIYSMVSAKLGMTTVDVKGIDMEGGFSTKDLAMGKLTPEFEEGFATFLANINTLLPGNITIRAVDHDDFQDRSCDQLERDIEQTKADVVIVDPFYYLHYEKNTSRTVGGDAASTSMRLRAMAGKTKTVIFAITQADEVKSEKRDENEKREIRIPSRDEVKKTKALLEDCSNLFSIDTSDGLGAIEINKSRNSASENARVEIIYLPSYGIVKEPTASQLQHNQFNDNF